MICLKKKKKKITIKKRYWTKKLNQTNREKKCIKVERTRTGRNSTAKSSLGTAAKRKLKMRSLRTNPENAEVVAGHVSDYGGHCQSIDSLAVQPTRRHPIYIPSGGNENYDFHFLFVCVCVCCLLYTSDAADER